MSQAASLALPFSHDELIGLGTGKDPDGTNSMEEPRMYEERRDHITRSFAVTANRRGARRFVTVAPHGAVSGSLVNIAEAGQDSSRRSFPRDDGFILTAEPPCSILDISAANAGDRAGITTAHGSVESTAP